MSQSDGRLVGAICTILEAVEDHWQSLDGRFGEMPPRQAIDLYCDGASAFDAVALLAEVLEVDLPVPLARVRRRFQRLG